MVFSQTGAIADILWYEIKNHAKNIEFGEFLVMPNHIHGIIILHGNNNTTETPVGGELNEANDVNEMNADGKNGKNIENVNNDYNSDDNTNENDDDVDDNGDDNCNNNDDDDNDDNVETRHALSLRTNQPN